ncbi:hypothetical protein [Sphingomonas sp. LM7]|uniref:hypothetical protein n=1 Tax=Sphingomonas sp. LM7 TaxID=1938607 RepID=UPI0009840512|nr:hypothetical protein [Sphingomonas sp. LM7]AQR73456.1 hypothetical protein BXU08_07210 [Sphingomonas sp. LM7]
MKLRILLPLMLASVPAAAQDIQAGITSAKTAGTVIVSADPALSHGRLVLRIAAQNRTQAPAPFGPASVRIATAAGEPVPIRPLGALIADVRGEGGETRGAVAGVVEAPAIGTNNAGQRDVGGYTGSMGTAVAQGSRKRKAKPDPAAEAQVAALRAGILTDGTIAPGAVVAGQLVSEKIKFRNKRERGLVVTVTLAGEAHSFAFDAPE